MASKKRDWNLAKDLALNSAVAEVKYTPIELARKEAFREVTSILIDHDIPFQFIGLDEPYLHVEGTLKEVTDAIRKHALQDLGNDWFAMKTEEARVHVTSASFETQVRAVLPTFIEVRFASEDDPDM